MPQALTIDLGKPTNFGHVLLTQRGDGNGNGRIRGYELLVSNDGERWQSLSRGELRDQDDPISVAVGGTRTARYVRLVAKSDWSGIGVASLAEFDLAP